MFFSNGSKFTTFDTDNDECVDVNCAVTNHGGWWYKYCTNIRLNGNYSDQTFDNWNFEGGANVKSSKMMFRIQKDCYKFKEDIDQFIQVVNLENCTTFFLLLIDGFIFLYSSWASLNHIKQFWSPEWWCL